MGRFRVRGSVLVFLLVFSLAALPVRLASEEISTERGAASVCSVDKSFTNNQNSVTYHHMFGCVVGSGGC